jgi:hypothetical protein
MSTFDLTLPGVTLDALQSALEGFIAERRIKYLPIGVVDILLTHQAHPNGGYIGLNGEPIHPEDGRRYYVLPVLAAPDKTRQSDKAGCGIYATASKDGVRVEVFFMRRGSRQLAPVVRNIAPNFASLFGDELATRLKSVFPEQAGAPPVIVPELNQSLPKRGKNQSKANEKQERKARVTRLRREGRTIEDIAEAENVSVATIKRDLGLKK